MYMSNITIISFEMDLIRWGDSVRHKWVKRMHEVKVNTLNLFIHLRLKGFSGKNFFIS